jgi:hypothetical protein
MKRIIMKLWIIALTSVIIGLVLSLAVAALLQDHVARPVSVGLTFWVQMVWMIPFFIFFGEKARQQFIKDDRDGSPVVANNYWSCWSCRSLQVFRVVGMKCSERPET